MRTDEYVEFGGEVRYYLADVAGGTWFNRLVRESKLGNI